MKTMGMHEAIEALDGHYIYDTISFGKGATIDRASLESTPGEWLTVGQGSSGSGFTVDKTGVHTNVTSDGISKSMLFHIDQIHVAIIPENPNDGVVPDLGAGDIAKVRGLLPGLQFKNDRGKWIDVCPLDFISEGTALDRADLGIGTRAGDVVAAVRLGDGATLEGAKNPKFRLTCNDQGGVAVTTATTINFRLVLTGGWERAVN
jgi:hypothetical protein